MYTYLEKNNIFWSNHPKIFDWTKITRKIWKSWRLHSDYVRMRKLVVSPFGSNFDIIAIPSNIKIINCPFLKKQ